MDDVTLLDALSRRRTRRDFAGRPIALSVVKRVLWAAQGLTDDAGNRTAPSAHGLHPLQLRVTVGAVEGLDNGLYDVDRNSQALRVLGDGDSRPELSKAALGDQPWMDSAACIVTLCADIDAVARHFADQPPQGERGLRYVYIEAGAAAQNALLCATAIGLGGVLVAGFDDQTTRQILNLEAPLSPLLHLCFGKVG